MVQTKDSSKNASDQREGGVCAPLGSTIAPLVDAILGLYHKNKGEKAYGVVSRRLYRRGEQDLGGGTPRHRERSAGATLHADSGINISLGPTPLN